MATIPASENEFPQVLFAEGAAAATPGTGLVVAYAKSDGLLYFKDDAGTEYPVSQAADLAAHLADTGDAHDASAVSVLDTAAVFTATDVEAALKELYDSIVAAGSVATDVIWDAANDLAVGSGANTAAKLAGPSADGMVLQRVSGSLAWAYPIGYQFDYAQITSGVNVTSTTAGSGTTIITGNAVTYDGSTVVLIEFFSPAVTTGTGASNFVAVELYEDGTVVGTMGTNLIVTTSAAPRAPVRAALRRTPSNASHTYSIRAFRDSTASGTASVGAGNLGSNVLVPAFLRITKAS